MTCGGTVSKDFLCYFGWFMKLSHWDPGGDVEWAALILWPLICPSVSIDM